MSLGSHENLLDKLLGAKSPFIPRSRYRGARFGCTDRVQTYGNIIDTTDRLRVYQIIHLGTQRVYHVSTMYIILIFFLNIPFCRHYRCDDFILC